MTRYKKKHYCYYCLELERPVLGFVYLRLCIHTDPGGFANMKVQTGRWFCKLHAASKINDFLTENNVIDIAQGINEW